MTETALLGPGWSDGKGSRVTAKSCWEGSGHLSAFLVGVTNEPGAAFARARSDISRLRASTAPARGHRGDLCPSGDSLTPQECFGKPSRSPRGSVQREVTWCLSPRQRCRIPPASHPEHPPLHPECQARPAPCPPPWPLALLHQLFTALNTREQHFSPAGRGAVLRR